MPSLLSFSINRSTEDNITIKLSLCDCDYETQKLATAVVFQYDEIVFVLLDDVRTFFKCFKLLVVNC